MEQYHSDLRRQQQLGGELQHSGGVMEAIDSAGSVSNSGGGSGGGPMSGKLGGDSGGA